MYLQNFEIADTSVSHLMILSLLDITQGKTMYLLGIKNVDTVFGMFFAKGHSFFQWCFFCFREQDGCATVIHAC